MNNEEKILAMLTSLTETVNKHGELLAKQGEQLAQINDRLEELEDRKSVV